MAKAFPASFIASGRQSKETLSKVGGKVSHRWTQMNTDKKIGITLAV
jgi:hypothetical protein